MTLTPPVWGAVHQATPARGAGYNAAQQGASIPPSMRGQLPNNTQNAAQPHTRTAAPQNTQFQGHVMPRRQAPSQNQPQPQRQAQPQGQPQPQRQAQPQGQPQPQRQAPSQNQPQPQRQQPRPNLTNDYGSTQGSSQKVTLLFHNRAPSAKSSTGSDFVNKKICTVGGNKKFVDFTDKLSLATVSDYANIHGIGGKDHARNSVIGVTLCDYTKGTGDRSITVKSCIDVEDVDQLYEAAKLARLGKLKPDTSLEIKWMDAVYRQAANWQRIPVSPDGTRPIPQASLNAILGTLSTARAFLEPVVGAPYYSYSVEKNNPYAVKNGFVPCYKLTINYSPFRKDGNPSAYPWYIGIETFDAPMNAHQNGTSSHDSKKAINKRSAFINLTCNDFWRAMKRVDSYIQAWEIHHTGPLFAEAEHRLAAQRESWEAENRR